MIPTLNLGSVIGGGQGVRLNGVWLSSPHQQLRESDNEDH